MSYPVFCTSSYYALGKSSWYDKYSACSEAATANCGAPAAGTCRLTDSSTASVTCSASASSNPGASFSYTFCPDDDYLTGDTNQYIAPCDVSACPSFAEYVACSVRPIASYPTPGTSSVAHYSYRIATVCRETGRTTTFERAAHVTIAPVARASLPV